MNACWRGCNAPFLASPSMVVTVAPSFMTASTRHALTRRPSTSTVQAPHWPWSQPFLVPVRSKWSRSASSKVVHGASSSCFKVPFTVSAIVIFLGKGVGVAIVCAQLFLQTELAEVHCRDVAPRSARVGDLRLRPHHLARAPRPTSHELPDGLPLWLVARGARDEAMMGRPRTNGLGRCLHGYHPVLDTKTELCVRMRALNFGMSTLSGSVKFG